MLTFIYLHCQAPPSTFCRERYRNFVDWLIDWVAGLSTWLRTQKSLTYIVQFRNTQFWWQVLHSGVCSTVMRFNSWNSNCIQSIFCYVVYGSFSYSLVTACKYTWCTFFQLAHARLSWHLLTECCKRKTCTHVVVCYPTLKCSELTDACVGFDLSHVAFVSQKHSSQNDK